MAEEEAILLAVKSWQNQKRIEPWRRQWGRLHWTEKLNWREIRIYHELLMAFLAHTVPRISFTELSSLLSLFLHCVSRCIPTGACARCFRGNLFILFTFQELECLCFFFEEQPSFRILSRCTDVKARHVLYGWQIFTLAGIIMSK